MVVSVAMKACAKTGTRSKCGIPVFVLCTLMLLASAGCRGDGKAQAAPAMPPPLVSVAQAVSQDVPVYLDEIGRNAAFESVSVMPQVGGRIVERHFRDGANLKEGQILFVIDPRPYKAQFDSAQANLAQQKAVLDLARIQFERDAAVIEGRGCCPARRIIRKTARRI